MDVLQITLILATFLCSLVAGFLFAFTLVVMPGTGSLSDREFLRAFQVMDNIIQNNQPVFMLAWVGSTLTLVTSAALGIGQLGGMERLILILATGTYIFGVQLPTVTINVPLNNRLQSLDVAAMSESMQKAARDDFEPRWNQWNFIRTVCASLVSVLLIVLLFKM